MLKEYVIYKDKEEIISGPSPLEITGIEPNTEVPAGMYKIAYKGSKELIDIPAFKTAPISVESISLSPKTSTATAGTAGSRQIKAIVFPENASNKKINYVIRPVTKGLSVSETGTITWTETVPAGTYVTEGETEDGKKTAQHTLTLNNQA